MRIADSIRQCETRNCKLLTFEFGESTAFGLLRWSTNIWTTHPSSKSTWILVFMTWKHLWHFESHKQIQVDFQDFRRKMRSSRSLSLRCIPHIELMTWSNLLDRKKAHEHSKLLWRGHYVNFWPGLGALSPLLAEFPLRLWLLRPGKWGKHICTCSPSRVLELYIACLHIDMKLWVRATHCA